MSDLLAKLMIISISGLISCILYYKLTCRTKWNYFQISFSSILLGISSFIIAEFVYDFIGFKSYYYEFWSKRILREKSIDNLIKSVPISIILAIVCSIVYNNKLVFKIGRFLKISRKYSDPNLYSSFLNSSLVNEILFKDISNKIIYQGVLISFCSNQESIDVVLKDVKVFDYTSSNYLYKIDSVILTRQYYSFVIEVSSDRNN